MLEVCTADLDCWHKYQPLGLYSNVVWPVLGPAGILLNILWPVFRPEGFKGLTSVTCEAVSSMKVQMRESLEQSV